MKITFYGGIDEIGGNKILVEADHVKAFLDFGKSFKEAGKYFEEFVNPRSVHGLKDYFELGLTPKLDGIYRSDLLKISNESEIKISNKNSIDAVLLSHGHMDHAGYLSFLDPKIPVYTTSQTLPVLRALHISRPKNLENEIVEVADRSNPDVKFRKKSKRNFIPVLDNQTFSLGSWEVTPYCFDHSIPGSAMFLIKTKNINLLYSGDFRLSEVPEEKKKKMYKEISKQGVDVFLCEGTRISASSAPVESEVYDKTFKKVKNIKGLAVVDYSMADMVRFNTLNRVAINTHRFFAMPYNYFNYLSVLKSEGLPVSDFKNVRLYAKQKIVLQKWEKELLNNNSFCKSEDIKNDPDKYMVALNFYQIQELIDWGVDENSLYVRAITEPHNEEMEISEQRFINWLKHFNMQGLESIKNEKTNEEEIGFDRAHVSGHISGIELKEVLENIKPKMLIPIHTEYPEEFQKIYDRDKIKIVKKGETITIN